jgi:sporulenol synthase
MLQSNGIILGDLMNSRLLGMQLPAVQNAIILSQEYLLKTQSADGSWVVCLEGSILPDSYFIIINNLFDMNEKQIVRRLTQRILEKQLPNGGFSSYPGDGGNLSMTVEAYLALSMMGLNKDGPEMRRMREFIQTNGGLDALSNLTKFTLAVCGQISWSRVPAFPVELIHFNHRSPLSVYDFVSFTRVHLVPFMILYAKRFTIPLSPKVGINELRRSLTKRRNTENAANAHEDRLRKASLRAYLKLLQTQHILDSTPIRKCSLRKCEHWILERLESDGTLGSYILSTFFGILALRAVGYDKDASAIQKALKGLKGFIYNGDGLFHMQACTSTVWDTALTSYILQESGIAPNHPKIVAAAKWLINHQTTSVGDFRFHNPYGKPGGWGFQLVNELYPDVDDTAAAVLAIRNAEIKDLKARDLAVRRGIDWVLSMQNSDGGWSAFDRNCNKRWLEKHPFNDMGRALTDPSSADMTGRTLEFLGTLGHTQRDHLIARAVAWLKRNQEGDGSWFGRWGIAYIYGSWAALTGLSKVGVDHQSPMVRRAVTWLESIQNSDGGWGESCAADVVSHYVHLGFSNPSQTAWALLGLIASTPNPSDVIRNGINYLLSTQRSDGSWSEDYPTGSGFAGKLYLNYHMYRNIWPLFALTRFRSKYV